MIAYMKGQLVNIQEEALILDVNGIGYEILCPNPFYFQQHLHAELFIHTYHHVREDIQCLFGFKDEDEKYLFTKLISVAGIGPKSAISMLSTVNVPDFVQAVEKEDEKYLTQFPGVGKKTARQIILDLKGKLTGMFGVTATEGVQETDISQVQLDETEEALLALGYTIKEVSSVIPELRKETTADTESLIRTALKLLMKS